MQFIVCALRKQFFTLRTISHSKSIKYPYKVIPMEIFSSTTKTAAMTAAKHLRLKARIKQNVTDNTDPEILCAKLYTVKVQVKILGVWVTVWAETCDYSDGKTPALMQGTGGRTINTITDAGGGHIRIRRLTPTECARLQTVPDWYKWVVSETQQYKMLGNGWTVEVIKHIFSFLPDRFKQ